MPSKTLKARDVENLENTSFASAFLGGAHETALPEASPCCPCTACSQGSVVVPNTNDLLCQGGATCTSVHSMDTPQYVLPLVPQFEDICREGTVCANLTCDVCTAFTLKEA